MPLVFFYTPRKHHEMSGFLMFSVVVERDQWHEIGEILGFHIVLWDVKLEKKEDNCTSKKPYYLLCRP